MSDEQMKALIVVDVQYDFCEGGALAVEGGNALAKQIGTMLSISRWRNQYKIVVFTQDWHKAPGDHFEKWPKHCVANTPGAEIHEDTGFGLGDWFVRKGRYDAGYSGFSDPSMDAILNFNKITDVDVCGIAREYCVKQTAYDAVYKGYTTRILHDLCVGIHDDR